MADPGKNVRRILFPTDFSECSEEAAAYVRDMAGFYGADVHVLHVLLDLASHAAWYSAQLDMVDVYRDMREDAERQMKRYAEEVLAGVPAVRTSVEQGTPHNDILRYAEENDINMIVMGTHGRKAVERVLLGSTAFRVLKRAKCPVLTIRSKR